MFITVDQLRESTKGLDDIADDGILDSVLQTFIDDGYALISQRLSRRYALPMMRTIANKLAWDVLATALKHYCRMRCELYLRLQEPIGEDSKQVVDAKMDEKQYNKIMDDIASGKTVLMGLERSDQSVGFNMRETPFTEGFSQRNERLW